MISLLEDIKDLVFGNKRLEDLKRYAKAKGFLFDRRKSLDSVPIDLLHFNLFKYKEKSTVKGFLYRKENQHDILGRIFDLKRGGDFNSKITTVYQFSSEKLDLPYLYIYPKSGFGKLGSIFKKGDWDHLLPEFNNNFEVQSDNMNQAYMLVTIVLAELLIKHKDLTIEAEGHHLFLYKDQEMVDLVDIQYQYQTGLEIIDILMD